MKSLILFICIFCISQINAENIILVNINNNINAKEVTEEVNYQISLLLPNSNIKAVSYSNILYLPKTCMYKTRYRAEKAIVYIHNKVYSKYTVIGITNSNISTSVYGYYDYDVRGLSDPDINTCIVSNYSIDSIRNFAITIIHEYLHTKGLEHCPNTSCVMTCGQNDYRLRKFVCKNCLNRLHL